MTMLNAVSSSSVNRDAQTAAVYHDPSALQSSGFGDALRAADQRRDADGSIATGTEDDQELRETFRSFVGQTMFGLMLKEMRKSVHKVPYFHGGQAEEIFQQQLDMTLAEEITNASADRFSDPMFELFQLRRS